MKFYPMLLAISTALWGQSSFAASKAVVIGYQTNVEPAKVAQADGAYEREIGQKIDSTNVY